MFLELDGPVTLPSLGVAAGLATAAMLRVFGDLEGVAFFGEVLGVALLEADT